MKRPLSLTLFTVFCLLFTVAVHAQGIPNGLTKITLTSSSDNPAPGQTVTVTAVSYSFDINSATVTWTVSGKQVQKGIGLTTLNTAAPALGKKMVIEVAAVSQNGGSFSNSITIGSGSVDMIIETDGYSPPFFGGKTPLVFQNTVTVIAVPHLANASGQAYDPATLIYRWKKDDGTALQSQSGYGKQAITLAGGLVPRPFYLIVTVTARDGTAQGQGLVSISYQSPSITFYHDDPLYGSLFNNAVNNTLHIGSQKETRVFAALFGFNFSPINNNALALNWSINGTAHPELDGNQSVVLRAPDGISGTSRVALDARGVQNILQGANNAFTASFNATQSSASTTPITF